MANQRPTNDEIADTLERIADLLETQEANPFRVRAYRQAAGTLRSTDHSVAWLVREGEENELCDLSGIGDKLASLISEYVRTGRSTLLSRLQGEVSPEDAFTQVPGIGDELAERIAEELDVRTLEELEQAAHDGRLEQVEGFGAKRVENVRLALAGMLSRSAQRRQQQRGEGQADESADEPDVGTLLDVDREYREKAEAGELKKIAPRRFNPEDEAWLPILHTERGEWDFTVLYSNTARAHELDKTHDWVVIYYDRDGTEKQVTVVTETSGPLEGERVVRGREEECRQYYEQEG
jgi:Holliday junction resolvasome RuvABC DNA-binding subunit